MEPLLYATLYRRLDPESQYQIQERAGIVQHEGGQTRDIAEYLALVELLADHPGAFLGVKFLRLELEGRALWLVASPRVADELCTRRAARYVDIASVLAKEFGGLAVIEAFPPPRAQDAILFR